MSRLVDSHCHLFMEPLGADVDAVLRRARAAGVQRIVVPAFDRASWGDVNKLQVKTGVYPAFGLHPWVAHERLDLLALERRLRRGRAVAVGEIGLDFAIAEADRGRQVVVLRRQLELARDLALPVLLHCRKAFDELIGELRRFSPYLQGVMHAYSRGPELAARLVGLGLHLAFGGAVTRPRAKRARRSCQRVPAERLLLETDAPAIGLDGVDPPDVEPRHLLPIAQAVAESRGQSLAEIARITTDNAGSLFSFTHD